MTVYMVCTYDMWWGKENSMAINNYKVISSHGIFTTLEGAIERIPAVVGSYNTTVEFFSKIKEEDFEMSNDYRVEVIEPVGEEEAYATGIIKIELDKAESLEFEW